MTVFDALLLAVVGVSIFFAAIRGAIREVATLAVLAFAALLGFVGAKPAASLVGKADAFLAGVAAAAIIAVIVFVAGYLLLHKGMIRLKLTGRMKEYDRIGGGVFGLARALALIGLGFLGYGYYLDEGSQPDAVRKALLLPVATSSARFFEQFAPTNRDLNAGAAAKKANAASEGYDGRDRSGLKEIVTTVTTTEKGEANSVDPIADILTEEAASDGEPQKR